jgi:cell division protein ZapA (FtsZ GTPase activity inhibitor)
MTQTGPYISFEVLGERFTIRSDVDRQYFMGLVDSLKHRVEDVQKRFPKLNPLKALILAAINISDEMEKQKKNVMDKREVELIQHLSQSLASAVDQDEEEQQGFRDEV